MLHRHKAAGSAAHAYEDPRQDLETVAARALRRIDACDLIDLKADPPAPPGRRIFAFQFNRDEKMLAVLNERIVGAPTAEKGRIQMKILVVDDHALIREALSSVLKQLKHDADILEASNCLQAMQVVEAHADLNLVVLDLTLPDGDGFSMLSALRERRPAMAVVVLSAVQDRETVQRALDCGAQGFITKSATREVMCSAFNIIFAGDIYIPPALLGRGQPPGPLFTAQTRSPQSQTSPSALGLTERQLDVLALLVQGMSNKAIGRTLGLAEPTVKNHVTAILRALKVTNRTEAAVAVNKLGWDLSVKP